MGCHKYVITFYHPKVLLFVQDNCTGYNIKYVSTIIVCVNDKGAPQRRNRSFSVVTADISAEGFYNHVSIVKEWNLEAELVGQIYDSVAIMEDNTSGLQKQVQEMYFLAATFNECCSNLVLWKGALYFSEYFLVGADVMKEFSLE